ncbi:hypothetical protein Thiowin_03516 [Thiorhodovibrio winogradskyi]|uniref:Uncharacterized protein n=1 Tax=Thiorhodovibrio winogradskyi TaxID=77007 RepID=A0ABZ0SBN1_9GAMM|nr:hypothetical protein [Thiorhodovibrio winogradskyi]
MGPVAEVVHKCLSYLTREDLRAIRAARGSSNQALPEGCVNAIGAD